MDMIIKTKPKLQLNEQTKLLRLVLQEVRTMRQEFQQVRNSDALLADIPDIEAVLEEGETVIFNADRDNGGKGISAENFIKAIDAIDG